MSGAKENFCNKFDAKKIHKYKPVSYYKIMRWADISSMRLISQLLFLFVGCFFFPLQNFHLELEIHDMDFIKW